MPCSNGIFTGDPAWGMLTDPSAIHPKQVYPAQKEAEWRSPDPQPLHQRDLIPASSCTALREAGSPGWVENMGAPQQTCGFDEVDGERQCLPVPG